MTGGPPQDYSQPHPGNGTEVRLRNLEKTVDRFVDMRLDAQVEKIDQLQDDMKRLRTALLTFGFSILAAAVLFALAVFRILGGN